MTTSTLIYVACVLGGWVLKLVVDRASGGPTLKERLAKFIDEVESVRQRNKSD